MIDTMMQSAIRAMGYEPDEFKGMLNECMNALIDMNERTKRIEEKLERLDNHDIVVTNVQVSDQKEGDEND